jgi:hypothetical protein
MVDDQNGATLQLLKTLPWCLPTILEQGTAEEHIVERQPSNVLHQFHLY